MYSCVPNSDIILKLFTRLVCETRRHRDDNAVANDTNIVHIKELLSNEMWSPFRYNMYHVSNMRGGLFAAVRSRRHAARLEPRIHVVYDAVVNHDGCARSSLIP